MASTFVALGEQLGQQTAASGSKHLSGVWQGGGGLLIYLIITETLRGVHVWFAEEVAD